MHLKYAETLKIISISARFVGRWITPSVPFLEFDCIFGPTDTKQQDRPASLTITMLLFLVWHLQMQDIQKPKVKTGIIPPLLRKDKMQGLYISWNPSQLFIFFLYHCEHTPERRGYIYDEEILWLKNAGAWPRSTKPRCMTRIKNLGAVSRLNPPSRNDHEFFRMSLILVFFISFIYLVNTS